MMGSLIGSFIAFVIGFASIGGAIIWGINKKVQFMKIIEVKTGQTVITNDMGKKGRELEEGKHVVITKAPIIGEVERPSMSIPTSNIQLDPIKFKEIALKDGSYCEIDFLLNVKVVDNDIFYKKVMSETSQRRNINQSISSSNEFINDSMSVVRTEIESWLNRYTEQFFKRLTLEEALASGDGEKVEKALTQIEEKLNNYTMKNIGIKILELGPTQVVPTEKMRARTEEIASANYRQTVEGIEAETRRILSEGLRKQIEVLGEAAKDAGMNPTEVFRVVTNTENVKKASENGGKIVFVNTTNGGDTSDIASILTALQSAQPDSTDNLQDR